MLARAADVPDYTWFWWKLRPQPRLGTVEIRALDAQTSLADTAALVALVHCLARGAAEAAPSADRGTLAPGSPPGPPRPPTHA
jgi:glutamate---cysteine ligase / carboxylate-amine ligase